MKITSGKILLGTFLLLSVFLFTGGTAQAVTSTLTVAETVANASVGTDDQTATLASTTPNVVEVRASTTLTVVTPPVNSETIVIGACTVTFQVAASSSATCIGNTANVDVGDGANVKTAAQVATELKNLTHIYATSTPTVTSLDTVVGSTSVAVGFMTSASTTETGGEIRFTDGTAGKIIQSDSRTGVAPVAEIDSITIAGTVDTGDIFTLNTGVAASSTYAYTVLAGATTLRLIADGLYQTFQDSAASTSETFTVSTTTGNKVVITADTAGTGNTVYTSTTNYPGVAQVVTFTPAGVTAGEIFKISINSRDYSYTALSGDNVASVVAGLVAALAADPVATCTDTTTEVTCTAKTAGTAFSSYAASVSAPAAVGSSSGGSGWVIPVGSGTLTREILLERIEALRAALKTLQSQQGIQTGPGAFGQQIRAIAVDLNTGLRNDNVRVLQQFLIAEDKGVAARALAEVGATSYFGSLTRAALAEFQAQAGIRPAAGYFGPITRNYINSQ